MGSCAYQAGGVLDLLHSTCTVIKKLLIIFYYVNDRLQNEDISA